MKDELQNDHYIRIYQSAAKDYHQLISAEDPEENLLKALERLAGPLRKKRTLDLGTGTGRIPLLIANQTASFTGLDLHAHMLAENQVQRNRVDGTWQLVQGDMQQLPFVNASFDLVTAGWAIGHFTNWYAPDWKDPIQAVLNEMHRVVSPGGTLIIMEIMGLGVSYPVPPSQPLADYYTWLEKIWDFQAEVIPFDLVFKSSREAVEKLAFFFGDQIVNQIRRDHLSRISEWAGIWYKRFPG